MTHPLNTLFYQWALDEDTKKMPTIFEDINGLEDAEKISSLLEVFAHLTADVIESSIMHNAVVEHFTDKAANDPEVMEECSPEEMAEIIQTLPDVEESADTLDDASRRLDLFQTSFTRALTSTDLL